MELCSTAKEVYQKVSKEENWRRKQRYGPAYRGLSGFGL